MQRGLARLFAGDLDQARSAIERALRLCAQHAFRENADEGLAGLAAVAAAQGRSQTAARLQGASHALGYPPATFDRRIDDRLERDYIAAARMRYGDIAWRADEQVGAGLSRERANAYALAARSERSNRNPMRAALAPISGSIGRPGNQPPSEAHGLASAYLRR